MRNYSSRSLVLAAGVLMVLLGMYMLPDFSIGGRKMRKVDLLSDIRMREPDSLLFAEPDTLSDTLVFKPAFIDTCRSGLTCIEDFSDSTKRGMTAYYEALDRLKSKGIVRIAVFGDSFIEADIFTADLRALLQQRYGGCGVGYVPVTSSVSGFRPTVRHSFGGWQSHAVTDTIGFRREFEGISGHYSLARGQAYVELKCTGKYAACLDSCHQATFFFLPKDSFLLSATVNETSPRTQTCVPKPLLQSAVVSGNPLRTVRWDVTDADSTLFYGMALDGSSGIVVDNFSLRGSSGITLGTIPARFLKDFNRLRPYDLIILQYGLNVATERGVRYDNYLRAMQKTVNHLKSCFPQASLLLVSVGDRDYKTEDGDIRTMPGIRNLVRYQQRIAAESGIAFWNLFQAMGGNESMLKLVESKPSMANYDYTHINFRGGRRLAGLLFETLEYGKEQYDKRKAYEQQ